MQRFGVLVDVRICYVDSIGMFRRGDELHRNPLKYRGNLVVRHFGLESWDFLSFVDC